MNFWKLPELDLELEKYLDRILEPVSIRPEFSRHLKNRLMVDFPVVEKKNNLFESIALTAASIFSLVMLLITGIRAVIFLLSVFGLLRQNGNAMQQKRTAA